MQITDDQLSFDHHLAGYRRMGVLNEGSSNQNHWHAQAAEMHYHYVHDALRRFQMEVLGLSDGMLAGPTFDHLRYGAGRRLKIIWQAIRDLHAVVPPDRHQPMTLDEVDTAACPK